MHDVVEQQKLPAPSELQLSPVFVLCGSAPPLQLQPLAPLTQLTAELSVQLPPVFGPIDAVVVQAAMLRKTRSETK